MQRSGLPPPHPSLPRHPNHSVGHPPAAPPQHPVVYQGYQYPQAYYGSHYAQAYNYPQAQSSSQAPSFGRPAQHVGHHRTTPQYAMNSWYEAGNNRCTHPGCSFSGSHKSVELHMMDRHLIYPPGWEKRKKQNDWDADPSLEGKPIPIQGTSIVLDSPEVLEAWIAERKRRFPTTSRVEEKKRKMSEAVARGQLDLTASSGHAAKRRKTDGRNNNNAPGPGDQGRNQRHRGQDRERQKQPHAGKGWAGKQKAEGSVRNAEPEVAPQAPSDSDDEDDDDGAPEAVSSKVIPAVQPDLEATKAPEALAPPPPQAGPSNVKPGPKSRPPPPQPRLPPRNPFASRPTLLRNLLLPEMRITISNLSQAIRFLVDNDFLRDVELKPGQAQEANKIEVLKDAP